MRAEEEGNPAGQEPQDNRDSIWTIPLAWRGLYFLLFTLYASAGIGFLIWYHVFENPGDEWPEIVLSIIQGIGVNTVGAAGLALLTIEGPNTVMIAADYLRKKLIEPLEERRRREAEQRQREAMEKGRAEGHVEGRAERQAQNQAAWVAWNERRVAAEANGEPFDEPTPGTPSQESE